MHRKAKTGTEVSLTCSESQASALALGRRLKNSADHN